MGKRIISVLLIVGICLSVTACSPMENLLDIMNWITDNDNPLSGKSTDERILSFCICDFFFHFIINRVFYFH